MPRINPPRLQSSGRIQNRTALPDDLLKFSFKYIDLHQNPKFALSKCGDGYLDKFLLRLKDVSAFRISEVISNRSQALRCHVIVWSETSEPNGFICLNEQLRQMEARQFEITANEHGRVHGFLLDDVFYVVWIDPEHLLYS